MRIAGQADMTKLIVTFRSLGNAPKRDMLYITKKYINNT